MMGTNFISGFCSIQKGRIETHAQNFPASTVPLREFLEQMYTTLKLEYPKFYKMDTLCKLGVLATELIVRDKDLVNSYAPEAVAVVLANKNASLDTDMAFQDSISKMASPALFVYTLPNIVTGEICIRQGWKGENAFFIQEEFDVDFHVNYVDILLQEENTNVCLAGWVEVIGEDHEVFLYLVEKLDRGDSVNHSKEELSKLYKERVWKH